MKKSNTAKRMERRHKRNGQISGLNLTALMDIFTILVFFLMVNSGDVQVLKDTDDIIMPVSIADQMPKDALLVQVSNTELFIAGQKIADVEEMAKSEDDIIASLDKELRYQASRRLQLTEEEELYGRALIIQGNNEIPYVVLKKIMATAAQAEYRDISLAVTKTELPKKGE